MATVKHLSYCGITLPLTPSFIEDKWLSLVHNEFNAKFIDLWNFDQPNEKKLPTPNLPKQPKFSLDTLLWPTGASSPAYFHTIVEKNRLNQITSICSPNGDYNRPKPLVFFDGRSGKTITAAQMYICGAPRPLNQLGKEFSDLWLLTLTDQRFYWHFARSDYGSPSEAFPTWNDLYAAIGVALNVTISVETIPSAYKSPGGGTHAGSPWFGPYQTSAAALLDAVATQVGQRIVVGLDGTVKAVNWRTARTAASTYINTTNGRLISGGLISETDIGKYVPESVQVLFTQYENGIPTSTPYMFERFLTSLAIAEYGSTTGVPNTHMTIASDIKAEIVDIFTPPTNLAEITAYAEQAATDWYGWRLIDTDIVYAGIEPWIPTGWEDEIEWTLKLIEQNPALPTTNGDDPYTKTHIRRGPWTDTRNLPIAITGPFPTYEDDCLNGYLVQYITYVVVDSVEGTRETTRGFVQSYGIPCGEPSNPSNSGSGNSGSGPINNILNLNVVTNVCIDPSGGLILQKQNITVLSTGAISSVLCTTAKGTADCCPPVTPNPRKICCPNNIAATSIIFAIDGPIGIGCTQQTLADVATQQGTNSLSYTGSLTVLGALFSFNLYCDEKSGFRASGVYIPLVKPPHPVYYNIALATDPITGLLFGTIEIPGCGTVTVAATQPCGPESSGSNPGGSPITGSGASGSGTIPTTCCPDNLIPPTLFARFTGVLSGLGTVTLTSLGGGIWSGTSSGCGGVTVDFTCTGSVFILSLLGGTSGSATALPAVSCSPLVWTSPVTTSIGMCLGSSNVTVSAS